MVDKRYRPDDSRSREPRSTGAEGADQDSGQLSGSQLATSVRQCAGAVVLHVAGELDLLTSARLEAAITPLIQHQQPPVLVVDLSEVTFLASAGLEILVGAHRAAEGRTQVRIVADDNRTFRPIQLTGLTDELAVYPSVEVALNEVAG